MTELHDNQDEQLLELAQEARATLAGMSGEERDAHAEDATRAGHILAYAELIIRDSDQNLIPATAREQASGALTSLRDNGVAALSPPSEMDSLLEALSRFPASRGRDAQQAVTEIAERFQRSTSQRLRSIEDRAKGARSKLEEALAETATKIDELDTSLDARSSAIDQRIGDISTSLDSAKTATDELLLKQQERFNEKENEQETSLNKLRETHEEELVEIRDQQEAAGREHVEKMEAFRERASAFLDVIANTGMASQFQDRANKDERQASRYRVATIVIGLGAVALAAILVLIGEKGAEYVFAKLGIVTTMLVVAGFTGSHARRKQNAAEGWREFELKLSGFGAVLETLPAEIAEDEQRWLFRQLFASSGKEEPDRIGAPLRQINQDRDAA